jgi:polysaccharide biosynthesis PFTS motif protein
MKEFNVVFEAPAKWDAFLIRKYLNKGIPVWVIEPFHTYHHKKGIRFFPPQLPGYIEELLNLRKLFLISADELGSREIGLLAAEKAVESVENVFPVYRKEYDQLINFVNQTLKSKDAEKVFKKDLCDRLGDFFSLNITLHRVAKALGNGPITVFTRANVETYSYFQRLVAESQQDYYINGCISFAFQSRAKSLMENILKSLGITAKVVLQIVGSMIFSLSNRGGGNKKKKFRYGVSIIAPDRQLRGNQRGPNFIIDNKKIFENEVVYFPLAPLNKDQQKRLAKLPGEVYQVPKVGRFFSHYPQWKRLLYLGVKEKFLRNGEELMLASNAFFNYFKWQKVMEAVIIRHFITHADFGIGHIGRNIALNQGGVQTWYFTDSMNHGVNFQKDQKCGMHHPFWAYLYYDHFVTWNTTIAQFFKEHPRSFKNSHVVGCLWSEHIEEKDKARKQLVVAGLENLGHLYVLSCFDTTYSRNGLASYMEGVTFAMHLLRLADECPDIHIILKEKKDRRIHYLLDPVHGPKLLNLYNKMDSRPRLTICSNQVDASELISVSNMVVSFPFTSTTFEALSTNKPAIWHDPLGYYRDTLYGKVGGVVTHGYDELKTKVMEIKGMKPGYYDDPIPKNSSLMDPYRDGKAIDRFRKLLTSL